MDPRTVVVSVPDLEAGHCKLTPPPKIPGSVSCGATALYSWVLVRMKFFCALQESVFPDCVISVIKSHGLQSQIIGGWGVAQYFLQIHRLRNLLYALELLQKCENLFGIIVLQFVGPLLTALYWS